MTRHVVARRVRTGNLIPVHPGTYLVGHRARAPLALEAAALLACGTGAFLSHLTAAALSSLGAPGSGLIHVTVVGRSRRSFRGVAVHSVASLASCEEGSHQGLAMTAPALTILDTAGMVSPRVCAAVLNEARVQRLVSDRELHACLSRHPNRRGAGVLRSVLDGEETQLVTRSEAERRALKAMKASGIHPDASDHPVGPYRLDFWFERERVAVEVDGYRYHGTPRRFVGDRRRAAYLAARGIQTFPLTWADLSEPTLAMARLKATLEVRS